MLRQSLCRAAVIVLEEPAESLATDDFTEEGERGHSTFSESREKYPFTPAVKEEALEKYFKKNPAEGLRLAQRSA
jgi:hypothetical protein